LVAAILGAYLTRTVFEVALIVLSSIFGATLVLQALQRPADQISILLLVLVVVGIVIQAASRKSRGSD